MGVRGELFSTKVALQNRTYFFNVKENRLGDLYLNIVESKNKEAGGFDRQSVILFADDLQEFLIGFDESLKVMEKAQREKKKGDNSRRAPSPDRDRKPRASREDGEGPKPRTFRKKSEDSKPWPSRNEGDRPRTYRKDDDGPRPRTYRKDGEGSRPKTFRKDGESRKPRSFRNDDEGSRPRSYRKDNEGPKPRSFRKDSEGPKPRNFRKDDEGRGNRFSKDKPPKNKPPRRIVRKKD